MRPLLRSTYWGLLAVILALLLGSAVVGCDDLGGTAGTVATTVAMGGTTSTEIPVSSSDTLAPTTTLPPAVTVTTVHLASSETLLANGNIKASGIITEVWENASGRHLKIDYVDFLTGAAADAAAIADGVINPGEHVDNDYYPRNVNTTLRPFDVSDSVVITTYSRQDPIDVADPPVSWTTFWNFWNLIGPQLPADQPLPYGLWWIERDGDTIVMIEELWVP